MIVTKHRHERAVRLAAQLARHDGQSVGMARGYREGVALGREQAAGLARAKELGALLVLERELLEGAKAVHAAAATRWEKRRILGHIEATESRIAHLEWLIENDA